MERVWARIAILGLLTVLAVSCGTQASNVPGGQPNASTRPPDLFSFTSDRTDYIGEGQSKSFASPTAQFVVEPGTQRDYLQLVVQRADEYWSIDIAAPTGHALQVGTYENLVGPELRSSQTGVLFVYGEGRACDRNFGSATIKQILFDQQGRLLALQATFVQHCESADAGAFRGTLTYGRPDTAS